MSESASETAASRRRKGDELTRRWSDKAGESEISGDSRAGAEGGGRVVSVISTTPLWPLLYRAMPRWEHLSPPWHPLPPPCPPVFPCLPTARPSESATLPVKSSSSLSYTQKPKYTNTLLFYMYISLAGAKWVVKHEGFGLSAALNRRGASGSGVLARLDF